MNTTDRPSERRRGATVSHTSACSRATAIFRAAVCALLAGGNGAGAVDDGADLKPLAYNHPGLVVDLGVGLWAWPFPLDFDGDGDMDLLVACPDKPSNGVYFFENPGRRAGERLPVFKPGVRLGPARANMQLSVVDGRPRLLCENREYPAFLSGDFETTRTIYPTARIHAGSTRARMWRLADLDGDGDHDIVAGIGDWSDYGWDAAYDATGRWRNGPLHGFVYWIENTGNDERPQFDTPPRRLRAEGADIDVYGWPSPNLADFDGDGDLDLLCGEFLDGFTYFENRGTRRVPRFARGRRLLGEDGRRLAMDLQMITPTACDWDGDGDMDLVVGDEDGRVALVEHTGKTRAGAPVFRQPVYFRQQARYLKFGALATPFVVDWDSDGDEDILCGDSAGYVGLFENLGLAATGLPRWSAPRTLRADGETLRITAGRNGSVQGPCEAKWGYTTLSVFVSRTQPDRIVVLNSIWGRLLWGRRTADGHLSALRPVEWAVGVWPEGPPRPRWNWWSPHSRECVTQWRTTPLVTRWAGRDGHWLVMLDHEGFLTIAPLQTAGDKLQVGRPERAFVDDAGRPLRLNARSCGGSGRVKLAVVDWDGDGRSDVLANSENAVWFRNCGTRAGKIVLRRVGNLARRNIAGHTSSPAVCDFDRDGRPDLLIGAEDGRLYFLRHEACRRYEPHAQQPEPARTSPPARFPGLVTEEFVFEKAPFAQCHASTICETARGLVAAWFGGTREKAPDVGIWVSYYDGVRWSRPRQWADGVQHTTLRYPCWNPVLFQPPGDAPTLLFFKVGPSPSAWWGEQLISFDGGRTFRHRYRLPEQILGPVRCKPVLLEDGRTLLCGSSTEHDGWRVHVERVQLQQGRPATTWERIGPVPNPHGYNAIQPTFLRHGGQKLQMLCRTREGVIVTSRSSDAGRTWTPLQATELPNPNSGIDAVTLRDGRHLLVYNHLGAGPNGWGRRGMLNLAVSSDGETWFAVAVLEREAGQEFSYPAVIQSRDGLVHVTYTWKRRRIKHLVLDPRRLTAGPRLNRSGWPDAPGT
ncbi:MAG: hypothetical protein D6725_06725 [Planctomycetota bacterium]|nr:MAG: hypothetical protein D6725_06725 [Planctomycetota bacterium]